MSDRGRRFWSDEEKQRIVEASREVGASVSDVARRFGVNANLLFTWRRDPRFTEGQAPGGFVPVEVMAESADASVVDVSPEPQRRAALPPPPRLEERSGIIEIDLACGTRVRVDAHVNDRALARVLRILRAAG